MDKVIGLNNIGNTCFMNSLLQILLHCDELNKYMVSKEFSKDITKTYSDFILEYNNSNKSISPNLLKKIVGNKFPRFRNFSQEDSHEFIINFLDYLDDMIKEEYKDDKDIISNMFDSEIKKIIRAVNINEKSINIQKNRILHLSIPKKKYITMNDCLHSLINMDSIKDWETPKKKKDNGNMLTMITKYPNNLLILLKRYEYIHGFSRKLNIPVKITTILESELLGDIKYSLKGFILQHGSLGGGHYVSYVKVNKIWHYCNDSSINKITEEFALKLASEAYLLYYVKI